MAKQHPVKLRRKHTVSELQDGTSSNTGTRRESFMGAFTLVARGNNKKELHSEQSMNDVRYGVGLYKSYPLANSVLANAHTREVCLKRSGSKQLNHARGTDGWFRSMLVFEVRAFDNYMYPLLAICLNALLATILGEVVGLDMSNEWISQWDTVFSMVLKTSLAFLLVFRLNRCAMRFWEARGLWGSVTYTTRNLVSGILLHCGHSHRNRDLAIRWASSFCVAAMHFIRSEHDYDPDELAGFLTKEQISKLQDASHAPLYAATMVRHYLRRALKVDTTTPPSLSFAYSVQLNKLETYVSELVAQVSGMEKIRSTPLAIAYVTHLRTFLFCYCLLLPYVWVKSWEWATIPLVAFTSFALFGIEGVSSEVEIPFDRSRANHLALDGYCLVTMDSVMAVIVHDANLDMQGDEDEWLGDDSEASYDPDP